MRTTACNLLRLPPRTPLTATRYPPPAIPRACNLLAWRRARLPINPKKGSLPQPHPPACSPRPAPTRMRTRHVRGARLVHKHLYTSTSACRPNMPLVHYHTPAHHAATRAQPAAVTAHTLTRARHRGGGGQPLGLRARAKGQEPRQPRRDIYPVARLLCAAQAQHGACPGAGRGGCDAQACTALPPDLWQASNQAQSHTERPRLQAPFILSVKLRA
jgi:hypothetical protein